MSPDSRGVRGRRRCFPAATTSALALLGLLSPMVVVAPLAASPVRIHQVNTQAGFAAGTLDGVRVDGRGVLTLAADVDTIAPLPEPFAFAVARLPDGWAIGTGGEGRVLKLARDGKVSVLFDAPESNVFALLAESDGTLYVGTSPAGKVYRLPPGGKAAATPFFDPHETYIWALARGADGALWVATGTEGHLYRVDAVGKGELAYDGEDPHLRSLLMEKDGSLLIGTAGQGLILRRSPDGRVRTIYDSALSEVVALAEGPGGTLFAAVLASESSLVDLAPPRPASEPAAGGDGSGDAQATVSVTGEGDSESPAAGSRPSGARGPRSELVAISPAGLVEPVWASQEETVFALAWVNRRLFVGTGGEGRLYSVQGAEPGTGGEAGAPVPPLTVTLEHDFDQRQVVGLASGDAGSNAGRDAGLPVVLTTNAAALYRLSARSSAAGTYTSPALDSGQLARYGVFRWSGESPTRTSVKVRFRTGSSASPDASWTPWTEAAAGVSSGGVWEVPMASLDSGRFLQWQAELKGEDGRTPRILLAEASYRQVNQRPRIDRFGALDPGQILVPANFNPADQVYEPASPNREGIFTTLKAATASGDSRTKQLWKSGQRTLRWRATDPNGDALRYSLEVRSEAAADWLPVADDLSDDYYVFDATVLPDGRYRFRLTASDRDGNAEGDALTASIESEPVVVDHSPPRRERAELRDDGWRVQVSDLWNPLREAMLSIDAGEWRPVEAADGLLDGQSETLLLGRIPPAAKLVLLRLADAALNYDTFDLSSEVKR